MAQKKNPVCDKAYEMYKQGMKLVDIATEFNLPPGTVRRWKSTQDWDNERSKLKEKKKSERSDSVSWVTLEHEYVTDLRKKGCTLEELAEKYNVGVGTVEKYSSQHNWSEKRKNYQKKIQQKALEKSSDKDAERIVRFMKIADTAVEKAEQALEELERYSIKSKKKIRTLEYEDGSPVSKLTKETVDESETIEIGEGIIDRLGLSQITNALKNIKELYAMPMDMDYKMYQAEYEKRRAEKEGGECAKYESDGFIEALQGDVATTFKEDDVVET